jgi:hypothetical protein
MTIDPKNPSLIYVDADGEAHNLLPLDADGPTEWKHRAQKIKLPPLDPHKMYTPSEVASLLNVHYDTAIRRMKDMKGCVDLGTKETRHKRPKAKLRVSGKHLQAYLRNHSL